VAVMDWSSRAVLAWRLSNTMDVSFCVSALEEALTRFGTPEIFNTDQGSQPKFNQSSQRSCELTVSARQMPLQVFSSQGFCEASC
jgi:transposase InsO family protein